MYYVYFIQSKKYNETYIGSTNDLRRRLFEHNNGVEISTRRYKPWRLVYYEAYRSEKDAREREMKLKKHGNAVKELKKRIQRSIENGAKGLPHTKKNGAGFTLLEAIVAISVITVGLVGVLSLVTQTISSATFSKDKLIAVYLAQEGIEIVRNIRDTNWLTNASWNNGLGIGDWQVDYNDQVLFVYTGNPLNLETATGFYGYDPGNATKFQRKITISAGPVSGSSLNVKVEVFWQEKGVTHKVEAQENLYNWK